MSCAFTRQAMGNSCGMRLHSSTGRARGRSLGIAIGAIAAVSLSACSSASSSPSALTVKQQVRTQNREGALSGSVSAVNQTSDGFSVMVAKVTYPKNSVDDTGADAGVVTIAPLISGRPGDIAGFTAVKQGTSRDVAVHIQVQLRSGRYRVALYSGEKPPSDAQEALAGTDVTVTVQ